MTKLLIKTPGYYLIDQDNYKFCYKDQEVEAQKHVYLMMPAKVPNLNHQLVDLNAHTIKEDKDDQ